METGERLPGAAGGTGVMWAAVDAGAHFRGSTRRPGAGRDGRGGAVPGRIQPLAGERVAHAVQHDGAVDVIRQRVPD